ncbi:GON-4-like protein isoform X2 [Corythoichthys intestinalis]|nr:GON-4-like protein isoform X2 [Corythoichthys intestinalis]XP_057684499.1 GON-4-like protein isoform X2 [Corythoichthys intestinalis]
MKSACKRPKAEAADPPSPPTSTDGGRPGRRPAGKKRKKPAEAEPDAAEGLPVDTRLDRSLETKSKQHNLTSVNVRNIIHEVITNEHVVAMMKAAIDETEAAPPFEPKMTRSKLKEVAEKGALIPAWNISPIKKSDDNGEVRQFADIPLAEEDSSDEEYRPDDEEEDETAEDTFQESDFEGAASPRRGSDAADQSGRADRDVAGPPPPPSTDNFLEELRAVEAELAVCAEPYRMELPYLPHRTDAKNGLRPPEDAGEGGLMAYRTRSKRPLRDVPLGRLEAELRAPDITPDLYDCGAAPEDSDWTDWLRGLMTSEGGDDEECDDEDDPEYNFLADVDEPDREDYRDDKAVRITKKEVNQLMEELFETLKEDAAGREADEDRREEERQPREEARPAAATDPPAGERLTVKRQLAYLRSAPRSAPCERPLRLDGKHRRALRQQVQQHVQLLLQIHLLTSPVEGLGDEAKTTRQFLFELDALAQRGELTTPSGRGSAFGASNLRGALQLLEELRERPVALAAQKCTPDARGQMRSFPTMPAELAWIFATRPVFLYPQLLPRVSLDPAHFCPRRRAGFTAAEDRLLALGLRNLADSRDPVRLLCDLLLAKSLVQARRRILQCCRPGTPHNVVKEFRHKGVVPHVAPMCVDVAESERRPPVERDVKLMPLWLLRSLPVISKLRDPAASSATEAPDGSADALYPPRPPPELRFRPAGFVRRAALGPSSAAGNDATSPRALQEDPPQEGSSLAADRHSPGVFAKNVSLGVNGEKTVVWTREADRLILTACRQGGAAGRTFRRVSAQLGNKTAREVSLRFRDLLGLFRVTSAAARKPEELALPPLNSGS